jgi:hypothetical protein
MELMAADTCVHGAIVRQTPACTLLLCSRHSCARSFTVPILYATCMQDRLTEEQLALLLEELRQTVAYT